MYIDIHERYFDASGRCCPDCQSTDISYTRIPNAKREFEIKGGIGEPDEQHVDYFGPQRDYKCRNCDCEWSMNDSHRDE